MATRAEILYGIWRQAMEEQGILVDTWDQLEDFEKAAWIATVGRVEIHDRAD